MSRFSVQAACSSLNKCTYTGVVVNTQTRRDLGADLQPNDFLNSVTVTVALYAAAFSETVCAGGFIFRRSSSMPARIRSGRDLDCHAMMTFTVDVS